MNRYFPRFLLPVVVWFQKCNWKKWKPAFFTSITCIMADLHETPCFGFSWFGHTYIWGLSDEQQYAFHKVLDWYR